MPIQLSSFSKRIMSIWISNVLLVEIDPRMVDDGLTEQFSMLHRKLVGLKGRK